jgi:hypothetical protein
MSLKLSPAISNRPMASVPDVQVEQLSLGERILVGATPLVTVGSLIGLGYPPYAALLRWRICEYSSLQSYVLLYWVQQHF